LRLTQKLEKLAVFVQALFRICPLVLGYYHHILRKIQVKLTTFAFYCLANNFDIKVNDLIYIKIIVLHAFWPYFCIYNYI